jgi:hypothetical protein
MYLVFKEIDVQQNVFLKKWDIVDIRQEMLASGLPDGIFAHQKSLFTYFEGPFNWQFLYVLGSFGIFWILGFIWYILDSWVHLVYFEFLGSFVVFCGHLVYFVIIWCILWSFRKFCGHLVYFVVIGYIVARKIWQSWLALPLWQPTKHELLLRHLFASAWKTRWKLNFAPKSSLGIGNRSERDNAVTAETKKPFCLPICLRLYAKISYVDDSSVECVIEFVYFNPKGKKKKNLFTSKITICTWRGSTRFTS